MRMWHFIARRPKDNLSLIWRRNRPKHLAFPRSLRGAQPAGILGDEQFGEPVQFTHRRESGQGVIRLMLGGWSKEQLDYIAALPLHTVANFRAPGMLQVWTIGMG
jgi:hypothetical protein